MKIRSLLAVAAMLAGMAVSAPAAAQNYAYATGGGYTNMRAGPGTRYPVIARVAPGSRVYVLGCLQSYEWCEGVVQGIQGWITARRLEFLYAGRRVFVPHYYSYFDAPIISFRFSNYDDWQPRHRGRRWQEPPAIPNQMDGAYVEPPAIPNDDGGGAYAGEPPAIPNQDGGAYAGGSVPGVDGGGEPYIPPVTEAPGAVMPGGGSMGVCPPDQPC